MNTLKLSTVGKGHHKCRCCIKPAVNCIKLDSFINNNEDTGKTYKEILNDITKLDVSLIIVGISKEDTIYLIYLKHLKIPACKESSLPQQICKECGTQLINSYKFIQQACKISQQYLRKIIEEQNITDDFKSLHEAFIDRSIKRLKVLLHISQ